MTAGTQAATLYYEVILEVEDVNGTVKGLSGPESCHCGGTVPSMGCVSQFLFRERVTLILFKSSFFLIFQFLPVKANPQWSRFSLVWPWKLLQLVKRLVSYYSNALDIIITRTCSWCMFIEITFNLLLSPSNSAPDCSVFPHPWLILSPLSAIFPLRGRYLNIFIEYGEEIDTGKEIKNPEEKQGFLAEQCPREGAGKE